MLQMVVEIYMCTCTYANTCKQKYTESTSLHVLLHCQDQQTASETRSERKSLIQQLKRETVSQLTYTVHEF